MTRSFVLAAILSGAVDLGAPSPAAAAVAAPADADAPPPAPPSPDGVTATAATRPPDPRLGERTDGRLDPRSHHRWLTLPRIVLAPLRGLFGAIAFCIGAALRLEDRFHPAERSIAFFTWNQGRRGLRPAFYYSTIYVPELGLRYFDHLSLGDDTRLDVTATIGGSRYVYSQLLVEPTRQHDPLRVTFDVLFDRRGDLLYNGLGSHTFSAAPAGRYLMNALQSRVSLLGRLHRTLTVQTSLEAGIKQFANGDRVGGDPGIIYVYPVEAIPGFTRGTSYIRAGAALAYDSVTSRGRPANGLIARAQLDYTHGIDGDASSYERLAASLAAPVNVWAHTHVLWLQLSTKVTWQNGDVPVPFSELPTLGGPDDLRGFRFQDFRDYTAAWATAEYRWPLWMWLDAALFVDYGGVFGPQFRGFGARQLQPDVGFALRVVTASRFVIRAQLGYGFGEGFNFSFSGTSE